MSVIYDRRSIRNYKKDLVDKTLLEEIVRAGMYAPSGGNKKPWHFIIVDDKEVIKKIQAIKGNTKILDSAPAVIVLLGDRDLEHQKDMAYVDLGACMENMLLRATELGLGSCVISIFPNLEVMGNFSKLFKLSSTIFPYAMIATGYSDEKKEYEDRFIKSRIHHNEW